MDLISIDDLTDAQIERLIDRALALHSQVGRSVGGLEGRLVFHVFYENSTRTLMSFATAGHRLGASVVTLPVEQSSVQKGETLEDTARTLNAMRPDALVIRHKENGAPAARKSRFQWRSRWEMLCGRRKCGLESAASCRCGA